MHIEKFMIGKQQHMKWATGNQLLGVHESPKWALLWGNTYKAVHFAVLDMVFLQAKPCGGVADPLEEILTTLLAFAAASCCPLPGGGGVLVCSAVMSQLFGWLCSQADLS